MQRSAMLVSIILCAAVFVFLGVMLQSRTTGWARGAMPVVSGVVAAGIGFGLRSLLAK